MPGPGVDLPVEYFGCLSQDTHTVPYSGFNTLCQWIQYTGGKTFILERYDYALDVLSSTRWARQHEPLLFVTIQIVDRVVLRGMPKMPGPRPPGWCVVFVVTPSPRVVYPYHRHLDRPGYTHSSSRDEVGRESGQLLNTEKNYQRAM